VIISPAHLQENLGKAGEPEDSAIDHVEAGVMVILFEKDGEYWLILNRRSRKVEHHKGEICFPGGRKDNKDKDLTETALRETREEMGIAGRNISILGILNKTETTTGYLITPTVGLISYPYQYDIQNDEVEDVIEFPLSALFREDCTRYEAKLINDRVVMQPAYQYCGNVVFGATARILENLAFRVNQPKLKEPQ
jgi:8-oxo-dGTP pyrophosphatase MutT (NUDIX family)